MKNEKTPTTKAGRIEGIAAAVAVELRRAECRRAAAALEKRIRNREQ